MKSDSIIQDCHCFVNPFLGGICGFFGGRGAPASGGGFPSLSPAAPAFSLAFCPLSPQPPSQWEGGDFLLSYARGFAPCIPGNRPGAALAMLAGNRFFGRCRGDTCFAAVKSASGQSIIEKSSWGFGGFFQEAPNVSPSLPFLPAVHRRTQGGTANCTKMRKTVDIERVYWYNGGGKGRVPCSAPAERDAGRVRKG